MNPDRCDTKLYEEGKTVAVIIVGISKDELNRICESMSEWGPQVDWFYMGGRAVVKTLGDPTFVRQFLPQIFVSKEWDE